MSPAIDETTLTAYALNELNAEDRSRVESQLAEDPIARQTVADIQATATLLTAELDKELQSTPAFPMFPLPAPRRHRWATAAIGLAAAAAIAAGIGVYVHRMNRPSTIASTAGIVTTDQRQFLPIRNETAPSTAIKPVVANAVSGFSGATHGGKVAVAPSANSFAGTQHDNAFTAITDANTVNEAVITKSTRSSPFDANDSILLPDTNDAREPGAKPNDASAGAPVIRLQTGAPSETNRDRTIAGLIQDARQDYDQGKYTEGLKVVDDIHRLDSTNAYANDVRQMMQDKASVQEQRKDRNNNNQNYDLLLNNTVENFVGQSSPPRDNTSNSMGSGVLSDAAARNVVTGNVSGLNYYHGNGAYPVSSGNNYSIKPGTTDTESYNSITDNPFSSTRHAPLSTFAVDVDTASYSNVRRFIEQGQLPPADAVRIQDLINYFPYSTTGPKPTDADPVAVNVEVADCPWQPAHRLARIALKAKSLAEQKRPPSNLVFLLDVSGSMADENKLPLLKQAIKKLVNRLTPTDRVSIVTYAGKAQMTLESTTCDDESNDKSTTGRQRILDAIDSLNADGETNGGDGIQLAYKTAVSGFLKEGVNRVILATDGDFNVGIVDPAQLTTLIEKEATTGVSLTVLGLGMGNVKDATMEKLAKHGKGNYAYLDSLDEADKVLGRQLNATLVTVARDVKLQVEFNPATVASYRLIGYEDRAMPNKDFNNDQKTAGEMGAGHSVVALYELVPAKGMAAAVSLKYQPAPPPSTNPADHELMTVSVRYQPPAGGESRKLEVPVIDPPEASANASSDFRFTAAVASFGMILRNSPYRGDATLDQVIDQATAARGEDVGGYRAQFIDLARRAKTLCGK